MSAQPINLDDNIIKLLGIEALPEEKRLDFLNKMTELIQKRVTLRLMEDLSDDDLKEAEKLSDRPEELMEFMAGKADVAGIVAQETQKLKSELVSGVAG